MKIVIKRELIRFSSGSSISIYTYQLWIHIQHPGSNKCPTSALLFQAPAGLDCLSAVELLYYTIKIVRFLNIFHRAFSYLSVLKGSVEWGKKILKLGEVLGRVSCHLLFIMRRRAMSFLSCTSRWITVQLSCCMVFGTLPLTLPRWCTYIPQSLPALAPSA